MQRKNLNEKRSVAFCGKSQINFVVKAAKPTCVKQKITSLTLKSKALRKRFKFKKKSIANNFKSHTNGKWTRGRAKWVYTIRLINSLVGSPVSYQSRILFEKKILSSWRTSLRFKHGRCAHTCFVKAR